MRVFDWFGETDGWQRPNPPVSRQDVRVVLVVLLLSAVSLELLRSFADFTGSRPLWVEYLVLVPSCLVLLWRRRHPLAVGVAGFLMFFAALTWVPELGYQASYMLIFFFTVYSTAAWGRDRRSTTLVLAGIVLAFTAWIAWDFAVGQAVDHFRRNTAGRTGHGLLPPVSAWVLWTSLNNALYLGGAIALGRTAWWQARDRARLADQATTIAGQARALRDQAVVEERLRIARELHDVVAHHVSVMGIQAAGARRLLERDPATAAEALAHVEQSSRQAVAQMRSLLGALRGADNQTPETDREPQPGLASLPELYRESAEAGVQVEHVLSEEPAGSAAQVPLPQQLSLYRTVQEALTNVQRHSTARRASVTVRVRGGQGGWAEVEVLDDGRPRGGTSGTGLGLLGMRERITSHGGTCEIGPRVTGGHRVRVRLPLSTPADQGGLP